MVSWLRRDRALRGRAFTLRAPLLNRRQKTRWHVSRRKSKNKFANSFSMMSSRRQKTRSLRNYSYLSATGRNISEWSLRVHSYLRHYKRNSRSLSASLFCHFPPWNASHTECCRYLPDSMKNSWKRFATFNSLSNCLSAGQLVNKWISRPVIGPDHITVFRCAE